MKFFLLVALAAAVYAEPEADPWMLYGQPLAQPLVYNNWAVKPAVYSHVQPAVYSHVPAVYSHVVPAVQEATIHETKKLVGPGGVVDAKVAVAGQHTAYTVYKKEKRDAESDPAVVLNSVYPQVYGAGYVQPAVVPQYYNNLYNTYSGLYNTAYSTQTYVNPLRLAKREADSEADPALLYRSAYTAGVPLATNWGYAASPVVRPVVSSPYYYSSPLATNAWNRWY